jgi:hypothetical protein
MRLRILTVKTNPAEFQTLDVFIFTTQTLPLDGGCTLSPE